MRMLSPLLNLAPRSPELIVATRALAAQGNLTDWRGRPTTLSERTIQRWLERYRKHGVAAFTPRARGDKGMPKVLVSLAADAAFPPNILQGVRAELVDYIRGHWKAGATLKLIEGRTAIKFRELLTAAGCELTGVPAEALKVPRRIVTGESSYRAVHILFRDRKQHEDNRYHTRRSRAHLRPMQWLVGDVHPLDIVCLRDDGSRAHARLIGWLDCATNRLFADLVLCEAGTAIRNADLVQSFLRMAAVWGLPETLYIDNGREYQFADDLNDALRLVAELRHPDGRQLRVVRALPYHAASKPIEGLFATLERMLQDVPGHVGGDRMQQKTERVGRPGKEFPGTTEQVNVIVQGIIAELHAYPMRGHLAGRSPDQAHRAALDSGWRPAAIDAEQILTVFATDQVRTITQGVISIDGRRWHCPQLSDYFHDKIIARVPRFWTPQRLALLHIKTRQFVGIAEPDRVFAFDDPTGAEHSKKIAGERRAAIRRLARGVPAIDTVAEGLRIAAMLPPPPAVAPIATVSMSDQAKEIGQALSEPPAEREARTKQARTARIRKATEIYGAQIRGRSIFK
jgi:hypothetical protein